MISVSAQQARILRLRSQRLWLQDKTEPVTVARVLKEACGLQAQEKSSAMLGVRARNPRSTAEGVENALYKGHTILHTWCMRGTLHFISAQDAAWMLPLLGPVFIKAGARRNLELGLDDRALRLGAQLIRDELARRGPLTRHELKPALLVAGLPTEGQATIHLIGHAALEGLVCVGPERDGKPTYTLLEEWAGTLQPTEPRAALAELARCYLYGFAPATLADFAYWSGLPMQEARLGWEGIAAETIRVEVDGKPAWMPGEYLARLKLLLPPASIVHLLPRYDNYLLGYASRALVVAPGFEGRIHPGGGIIHAVVLVDGRAAGTWELKRRGSGLELIVDPFEQFPLAVVDGIKVEAAEMSYFLGEEIVVTARI